MMEIVALSDICNKITDGSHNPPKGVDIGLPMLSSRNIADSKLNFDDARYLTEYDFEIENRRTDITEGDVLLTIVGTVGRVYVVKDSDPKFTVQRSVGVLKLKKDKVLPEYLSNVIQSENFQRQLLSGAKGVAQKGIYLNDLKKLQIPLPPLSEQKRIAELLDAADTLRKKDKALLEKYDQLAQSLFLEMFGDPVKNEKGWEKMELKVISKVITGQTPPSSLENMFGGDIPFITPGDLESNGQYKRTVTSEGAAKSRLLRKGGLFVCCIGATIGKMSIASQDSTFNQQINGIDWTENVNDIFGFYATRCIKQDIIDNSISTTLPILKKSEFEKLKIIIPPKNLQNQFAEQVQLIEKQKELLQKNLEKSEELFGALMGEVFGN
jgi:type I restriction enzyme, S subunit